MSPLIQIRIPRDKATPGSFNQGTLVETVNCNCYSFRKDFTNLYKGLGQCTNCSYHLTKRVNIISCPFSVMKCSITPKPDIYQTCTKPCSNKTTQPLFAWAWDPALSDLVFSQGPQTRARTLRRIDKVGTRTDDISAIDPERDMIYIQLYMHHMFIVP